MSCPLCHGRTEPLHVGLIGATVVLVLGQRLSGAASDVYLSRRQNKNRVRVPEVLM